MARYDITTRLLMAGIAIASAAVLAMGCAIAAGTAQADEPRKSASFAVHPSDRTNLAALARIENRKRKEHAAQVAGQLAALREEHEREAAEAAAAEAAAAEAASYVYYEPQWTGYSGGSTATTLADLLNGQGRAYGEDGTSYTYYHDVYGHLDIPGEHKDADGVVRDADGYIVVAADGHAKGEVIDTPYGQARNYDSGSGHGNVDVYTGR